MKRSIFLVVGLLIGSLGYTINYKNDSSNTDKEILKTSEIRVRDPFILADENTRTYYLYASVSNRTQQEGIGVEVYTSKDLKNWTNPQIVFQAPENYWATKWVWAPEVHFYKDKYYLFATFTADELLKISGESPPSNNWPAFHKRGTQILVSDSPTGPFFPFYNHPHTNKEWMTLDGTLWEENNQPYMIYCHEWVQIQDGSVNVIPLKDDLSSVKGQPQLLFNASDAPWVRPLYDGLGYVTDGCFLYKTKTDQLLMIWSSFGEDGYAVGTAISESGGVKGPWKHNPEPLFTKDGGHGMIFKTFYGQLVIALHQPNESPNERLQLYQLKDKGDMLQLGERL